MDDTTRTRLTVVAVTLVGIAAGAGFALVDESIVGSTLAGTPTVLVAATVAALVTIAEGSDRSLLGD